MGDKRRVVFASAALGAALPILVFAFAEGPLPRHTGAPGDANCTACHTGTAVNAGPGKVEVSFPGGMTYAPGVSQQWTVTVTDPDARRWGFQLSVRLASNETNGQAGDLAPADGSTQVLCDDGRAKGAQGCAAATPVQFIEHTLAGNGKNTFTFNWTPPASDAGNVRVYVAGNGANGNGQNTGDRIYTNSYTLSPAAAPSNVPSINATDGVTNGASFKPGIAPSAWITVKGANLAGATRIWRNDEIVDGKLPAQLDGVSVTVNNKPAAVYYISPIQLNVQAPADDSTGPVEVKVTTPGGAATAMAQLQTVAPGLFMFSPENNKYAAAVAADGTYLGKAGLFEGLTTRPARPGEVILLFGTGFGPTNPVVPAGQVFASAAPLTNQPVVRIGNIVADVQFAGLTGAGLYQFNVKVPEGVPDGDAAVVLQVAGQQTQENLFLTIWR